MRMMRLVAKDGQSGGVLAVLLALCLALQAFAVPFAHASPGDPAQLVLCAPGSIHAEPGSDDTHEDGPCCPGICQSAACCAPPPAAPDLGLAWPAFDRPLAPVLDEAPPAVPSTLGPSRQRAPPASP